MGRGDDEKPTLAEREQTVIARRRHYGEFYGEAPLPDGYGLVVGNCQAESVRLVIDSERHPAVRMPPVHELTPDDARRLHELLAGAAFLVSQPIRDDYHDLPLGTRQQRAALRSGAPAVTMPIVRFAGLHPFQAALRVPGVTEVPPLAAYHDVRTLALAAGLPIDASLSTTAVREVAADSVAELRRREEPLDVRAADLLASPRFDLMRTVNHPGNAVFVPLGDRVLDALGFADAAADPGRPLLWSVRAPREQWVADAWPDAGETDPDWIVEGERLPVERVREAHLAWYARRPEVVAAAVDRLAPLIARWRAA